MPVVLTGINGAARKRLISRRLMARPPFGVPPLPVRQCGRRHRAPAPARVLQATGGDDSLTVSAVGMSAVTNFGPPSGRRLARPAPEGPGEGAGFRIAQRRRDL